MLSRSCLCRSAEKRLFGGGFEVIQGELKTREKKRSFRMFIHQKDLSKTQSQGDKERQFGDEKGQAVLYYLVKAFIHFSISSDEMRCSQLLSCHSPVSFCPTGGGQWVSVINIIDLLLHAQSMSLWLAWPKKGSQRWGFNLSEDLRCQPFGNGKKKVSQTNGHVDVVSDRGQRCLSGRSTLQ